MVRMFVSRRSCECGGGQEELEERWYCPLYTPERDMSHKCMTLRSMSQKVVTVV
jgi:hypothetical protein